MQLRNHKVQALTMELIEYLAFTCETPFFTQIATNDFLQRINTLLNPNMNPQVAKLSYFLDAAAIALGHFRTQAAYATTLGSLSHFLPISAKDQK